MSVPQALSCSTFGAEFPTAVGSKNDVPLQDGHVVTVTSITSNQLISWLLHRMYMTRHMYIYIYMCVCVHNFFLWTAVISNLFVYIFYMHTCTYLYTQYMHIHLVPSFPNHFYHRLRVAKATEQKAKIESHGEFLDSSSGSGGWPHLFGGRWWEMFWWRMIDACLPDLEWNYTYLYMIHVGVQFRATVIFSVKQFVFHFVGWNKPTNLWGQLLCVCVSILCFGSTILLHCWAQSKFQMSSSTHVVVNFRSEPPNRGGTVPSFDPDMYCNIIIYMIYMYIYIYVYT